jgi:hypothetical protein
VLLTPHIIERSQQTGPKTASDDISLKRQGAREGVHWAGRVRLAEDHYESAVKNYVQGNLETALNQVNWALEFRHTYLEAMRLREKILRADSGNSGIDTTGDSDE